MILPGVHDSQVKKAKLIPHDKWTFAAQKHGWQVV